MSKTPKAPRDPWRPKKPKKELRVQFSTWTTQPARKKFDEFHEARAKNNPAQKPGDTLAEVIFVAALSGYPVTLPLK